MDGEQTGRPIPKIIGRGKHSLKRPHNYDLRSTATRCQSSHNTPCSFCHHYKAKQDETINYNLQLRAQLFKTTTRALVIDKWRRRKDQKVKKLRGLLQDRAAELHEKNLEMQEYIRDARLRKDELKITVAQLDRSKEEVAELNTQLEQERKRFKTLQEVGDLEKHEFKSVKERLRGLTEQLSLLLSDFTLPNECTNPQSPEDSQNICSRLEGIKLTLKKFQSDVLRGEDGPEPEEISSSRALIYKIISDVLCGVCHEMFIDPVALPCGHAFCEFCIRMWFKRTRGCPVCRHKIVSCAQLHAVYQFRMIVESLETFRNPEEQDCRAQEKLRRDGLREELYSDPAPRRFRERPSSTTDRGERFSHRRRRVDGTPPVPYHIPLHEPNPPTARLDILQPPQPYQLTPLILTDMSEPTPNDSVSSNVGSERNVVSFLLNETFSSIDRFIRGSNNIFSMNRPPNMIESAPASQSNTVASDSTPSNENNEEEEYVDQSSQNFDTMTSEATLPEVGSPLNPIVVEDQRSDEDHMETPPDGEEYQYQSIVSESSEEIWPNNPWQVADEPILSQNIGNPVTDLIDLRDFEHHIPTEDIVIESENNAELEPLLDGDFLSTESDSEFTSGSETESESGNEDEEIDTSPSLVDID